MDRTMWRPLSAELRGWRRIAPDLPGFGMSDPGPADAPTMADYADGLAALLDQLNVDRAVMCGLSMGGYVAFELWRRHRARVQALLLLSTRAENDGVEARAGRESAIESVTRRGLGVLAKAMLPRLLSPATLSGQPTVVEHVRTMILGNQPEGVIRSLRAMRDRADSTALLAEIDVPTLVVAGADDAVVPEGTSRGMAASIRGARFERMAGVGHVPPLEAPADTARIIQSFLGGLS
jgi:pimeloyl-ACP methyl ester carboxylesterase